MNFIFTDEQIQFKDAIRAFLNDECTPESIRSGWDKKNLLIKIDGMVFKTWVF
jgi:hypothetical protein